MKKFFGMLLAVALFLGLSGTAAHAQAGTGTVAGKAVRWTGQPIPGATIRVLAGPLETDKELTRTTTSADGSYTVTLPANNPYWVHIDTFGSWWGYSYQTPFTVRPGESISQVYFALGPRDVKEIALPAPVSNVGPAIGSNPVPAPPVAAAPAPPVAAAPPPAVAPVAPPVKAPVSNVKPAIGYNPASRPVAAPKPAPSQLPATGASNSDLPGILITAALGLLVMGLNLRRLHLTRR